MLQWLARWLIGNDGKRGQTPSGAGIERSPPTILALVVLFGLAVLGVLALFIAAWFPLCDGLAACKSATPPSIHFSGRFLAFGILAGAAGAAGGGLLGLLFGLPTSAARAVAQSNTNANSPGQDNPWFTDNTAMEQIADWLTKIIVGLSLANFNAFVVHGRDVSIETSKAMTGLAAPGPAVGGLTLAPAVLIGFSISYIWIRRYLPGELAKARMDMIERQRQSQTIVQGLNVMRAADAAGDKQDPSPAKYDQAGKLATQAVDVTSAASGAWAPIAPGHVTGDPWKGQFSGAEVTAAPVSALLQASVKPVPGDKDWFTITIRVTPTGDPSALAGKRARLYLHPTFPNPVREIVFGKNGAYALDLVGWGAFTVGLQLENNELYELDLALLPDAPEVFKSR